MLFQIDLKCNISATGWIRGFFANCTNTKEIMSDLANGLNSGETCDFFGETTCY